MERGLTWWATCEARLSAGGVAWDWVRGLHGVEGSYGGGSRRDRSDVSPLTARAKPHITGPQASDQAGGAARPS